jgi:hypothetical protein
MLIRLPAPSPREKRGEGNWRDLAAILATSKIGETTDNRVFLPVLHGEKCPAGQ